jgi:hypothetical protein
MFTSLRVLPLFVVPLAIYAACAVATQGGAWTDAAAFTLEMFSGAVWSVSFGDLLVLASIGVLFVETIKASNTTASEIINHGLSMLVAVVCLILFVTTRAFTTSTFFFVTVMAFFDVAAGLSITIVAARRDIGSSPH